MPVILTTHFIGFIGGIRRGIGGIGVLLFAACILALPAHGQHQAASAAAKASRQVVAAADPRAVDAALAILDKGGSAVDAVIAAQLVLTLVQPHASGIGGGGYLLVHDARAGKPVAYDGRETAPSGAVPTLFLKGDGKPMTQQQAVVGGRSVGVPGTVRLLEVAHARHGKLPWAALFQPAIELSEKGFALSARVHRLIANDKGLPTQAAARAYFFEEDGRAKAAGTVIRNPELAKTLRLIGAKGSDAFYTGEVAADIVAAVRSHANPGSMSLADLAGYRVRDVEPLCGTYRAFRLCGMPPSSSGGIAVLQILGILEKHDMASVRPNSSQAVHLFSEAGRLAFADRNRYVADDRFVDVPVKGLLDRAYLAARASFVTADKSMGRAEPGTPPGTRLAFAHDAHDEAAGTSHTAIADRWGNVVSMTNTIEGLFGSKLMVRGFLLNNELTDFNFTPADAGGAVANSVAPGKRPRSSMAPFVVYRGDTGVVEMALGSAGGSFIINYVAKVLVGAIDWNLGVQEAIELPNMGSRNGPTEIEKGTGLEGVQAALRSMGHEVRAIDMASGLQAIRRTRAGWEGGADPRREGVARGH
jgi:gamma-glutamyltranspeptidase/glutathione hydrolase